MLKVRVIPTLLWKDVGLVKGKGFDSWRRVGPILPAVRVYNTREVDEMILVDVTATEENREIDLLELENVAQDCFVPLTVGGGIRTVSQMEKVLKAGADKISLNSICFTQPELISEGAKRFGVQCMVASVDFKMIEGQAQAFSTRGQNATNKEVVTWCKELESRGAGEILLTSIERDGTMEGYQLDVIHEVCQAVSIPVIASGGASSYEDMYQAIHSGASAVAAGALFHYTENTPLGAKHYLSEKGIPVRQVNVRPNL